MPKGPLTGGRSLLALSRSWKERHIVPWTSNVLNYPWAEIMASGCLLVLGFKECMCRGCRSKVVFIVKVIILPLGGKMPWIMNFRCWEFYLISADYYIPEISDIGNVVIVMLSLIILLLLFLLLYIPQMAILPLASITVSITYATIQRWPAWVIDLLMLFIITANKRFYCCFYILLFLLNGR